jgi:hypothetical protein
MMADDESVIIVLVKANLIVEDFYSVIVRLYKLIIGALILFNSG